MINRLKTEVAAFKTAFPPPKTHFCYWHFFRAIRSQANSNICNPTDRRLAFEDFRDLVWIKILSEFRTMWESNKSLYGDHEDWIACFHPQW